MRSCVVPIFLTAPMLSLAQMASLEALSVNMQEPPRIVTALELTTDGVAKPSSLQWRFQYNGNQISRIVIDPGEIATLAGKRISCSSHKDEMTCILWGLNRNAVADGVVAKATFFLNRRTYSGLPISIRDVSFASGTGDRFSSKIVPTPLDARPQFNTARYLRYLRHHRNLFVLLATTFLFLAWALYQIFRRTPGSLRAKS